MFDNERVTYPMFNTRYPKTCLADLSELLVRLLGGDLCTVLIWMVLPRVAGESETAALSQKKWFLDDAGSVHHFHQKYPISWHTKHSDSTIGAPLFPKKTGPNGLAVTNSAKGRSSKLLAKPTFGKRLTRQTCAANEYANNHVENWLQTYSIYWKFCRSRHELKWNEKTIENQRIWKPIFTIFIHISYTSSTAQGGGGSFRIGNL